MQRFARLALAGMLGLLACDQLRTLPLVTPRSTRQRHAPTVEMGPWILEPQANQVTIAWVTDGPVQGRVWYGAPGEEHLATEEGPAVTEHRVVLHGLKAGTQTLYRLDGAVGRGGAFTSAPALDDEGPFRVLIYGDNRTNSGDHALVARAAAAEHAPLALHTGDMVVDAKDAALWRQWFEEERDLLAHTPLLATVGNHEITDEGVAYSRFFQRRGKPTYWSIDYGPLHLVVLDSFERAAGATPHAGGMSEAQRAWLEEDLRRIPKDRHVWVLVHQGPYSHPARVRPGHGGSEPVRTAILAARKVHAIEAVFAGHEHFYERGEIDDLRFFVFGGGGAPLEDPDPSFPGVRSAQKALSYAVVEVCGCHVAGQVKDISGRVLDSFTLATCPRPCGAPASLKASASP